MTQFEYIAVLVSVIAGLGIVHLLRGVARFFTGSLLAARVRSHVHHAFWGVAFFTCMAYFEFLVFSVLRAD